MSTTNEQTDTPRYDMVITASCNLRLSRNGVKLTIRVGQASTCEQLVSLRSAELAAEPGGTTAGRWWRIAKPLADHRGFVSLRAFVEQLDKVHAHAETRRSRGPFAPCGHAVALGCSCS